MYLCCVWCVCLHILLLFFKTVLSIVCLFSVLFVYLSCVSIAGLFTCQVCLLPVCLPVLSVGC